MVHTMILSMFHPPFGSIFCRPSCRHFSVTLVNDSSIRDSMSFSKVKVPAIGTGGKAFNASMKNAIVVLFLYFLWNVSSFHVGVLDLAFLGYVKVVRARARGF